MLTAHKPFSKSDLSKIFMRACLTARLHHADLAPARKLARQPQFDWDVLLAAADEALVTPLLYEVLNGQEIAPPAVEALLLRKSDYSARRNLLLLHELGQTLALIAGAGLEALVLKGAALTETLYKNIALRPMRDLDLLVHREQRAEIKQLLSGRGYEQRTFMLGDVHPVTLTKPGIEPVDLELHWSLFHSHYYQQRLEIDWFWQTARRYEGSGLAMKVLGLEAQILHLCGHLAFHHQYEVQLLWLNDLAEFIMANEQEISWSLLLDKARAFELVLPTRQILRPLVQDWGAPIPDEVLATLEELPVSAGEKRAFAARTAVKTSEGQGYWLLLKEISGWRRRLVYMIKWFFPAPAALRTRYKVSKAYLLPLYYPYHWWVGARLGVEGFLSQRGAQEDDQ